MLWSTCFQNKINRCGWFGAMIKILDRLRYRTKRRNGFSNQNINDYYK